MDKVERVARALCAVDGEDPDEPIETGERTPLDFRGSEPVLAPRWHLHRDEARRFVAAAEALGTITSGGIL